MNQELQPYQPQEMQPMNQSNQYQGQQVQQMQQPQQPYVPYGQGQPGYGQPVHVHVNQQMQKRHDRTKVVAILLALFLGGVGAHKFYLGQSGQGILYLLFFWTWIPAIIALVEIFMLAAMSDEKFDQRFNY
jgi:TM2 domain-containing membrane protein YozV